MLNSYVSNSLEILSVIHLHFFCLHLEKSFLTWLFRSDNMGGGGQPKNVWFFCLDIFSRFGWAYCQWSETTVNIQDLSKMHVSIPEKFCSISIFDSGSLIKAVPAAIFFAVCFDDPVPSNVWFPILKVALKSGLFGFPNNQNIWVNQW